MPAAKSKKSTPAKSTKSSVAATKTKRPAAASGARKAGATAARKPAGKKAGSKREVIEPHKGDKRYVRRTAAGTFGKTVDMGKSLASDKRSKAKKKVPKGQGDRGDTRR